MFLQPTRSDQYIPSENTPENHFHKLDMDGGDVDVAAEGAAEADGKGNGGTESADPQTMYMNTVEPEKSWAEAALTNLEDDISAAHSFAHSSTPINATCPSPMAESNDVGEPTSGKGGHHSEGESIEPPPPPTVEEKKHSPQTSEVTTNGLFDHDILFDDCRINIQALDDGSVEARQKIQGWMNRRWIDAPNKVLSFTSPILRVFPSRYFWSAAIYEKRVLAIFTNPDVILILRYPTDRDEVRRLGGIESSEQKPRPFFVVESAADPKTCKIRLSQLTNITSVPNNVQGLLNRMNNPNKNDTRKQSCLDLLSPAETITLSVALHPADSFRDYEGTKRLLLDTHQCQQSIVSALIKAHSSNVGDSDGDQAWKHQLILGTTHSMVISGNDQALKESLAGAFEIQMNESGSRKIDPAIIDAKDDNGKTALHYACSRRKNSTVRILVNAGADCSIGQSVDKLTPCHICAKGLDEKTLSIVLSASKPTRPDPNALDCHGRTPMYLAAVEGKGDAVALDLCLSALAAWGGQLTVDSPKSKGLLHPVHCVSAQWKSDELGVILAHCNHRYPHTNIRNDSDEGINSLSAMFHYPIHASLISFRSRVHSAFQEQYDNSFNAEFTSLKPALIK
jgi:ankyrin repeat protein